VGWSGSGKTTLIESLLPHLREWQVGYLKSDAHGLRVDPAGKDTDRIFRGGAAQVAISSPGEAMIRFRRTERTPGPLLQAHFGGCDLVLVEGFKESDLPKIEVFFERPVLEPEDATLLAVVRRRPDPRRVPTFEPGDPAALARFVAERLLG
jgi:molybdopterin-guanine dinucleotide biosynthesis protein B